MTSTREILHAHLFCGLGGGARGFGKGHARLGSVRARFRCLGGIDVDKAAVRDFERLAGVPGTALDLFSREQYRAFHGAEPPAGWREAVPADIHAAFGNERPHIVFLSPPCKGFSGLLSEGKSQSGKYQALNGLTLRGIWLLLEAYRDDPPELLLLENVPRIASRGRQFLDQIAALLRSQGYAVAETTHDCGRLGGLAQSRKRFLMVARHAEKVPSFLYEPVKRPLRSVGQVLSRMPLPGDPKGGVMHRIPALQWKTWVRLAFVEAGSDWRSLNKLAVESGFLRDYAIAPDCAWRDDVLKVVPWSESMGAVTGKSSPTNGRFAVADPRRQKHGFGKYAVTPFDAPVGTVIGGSTTGQGAFAVADPRRQGSHDNHGVYGVMGWNAASGAVTGASLPTNGRFCVADPRPGFSETTHLNIYRIVPWGDASKVVTGARHTAGGALSVADPRCPRMGREQSGFSGDGAYGVVDWNKPSGPVVAKGRYDNSRFAVADPRIARKSAGSDFERSGAYGVRDWDSPCVTIKGCADIHNGRFAVADPRLPAATDRLACVIRALDDTWHRPFTTLELAALQGLLDPEEQLELDGLSDSAWRERIGNAVPPPAAAAIAGVMGEVLLLTWSGETFSMSASPIWVRPVAAALMAAQGGAV